MPRSLGLLAVLLAGVACNSGAGSLPAPDPEEPAYVDFRARCASDAVVRCVGFDDRREVARYLVPPGMDGAPWERRCDAGKCGGVTVDQRASGPGALRFEIPSRSGEDTSGAFRMNFSDDLSQQFGEGEEFYVQWRQRFSRELLETVYATRGGKGGWKTIIVGEGDRPGYRARSCSQLEIVVNNGNQQGFPQMYHSCGGKDGRYFGFHHYAKRVAGGHQNPLLQNVRTQDKACWWDDDEPDPDNCFRFDADEWMTFQLHVKVGTWYTNQGDGGNYPRICKRDPENHPCDSTMRLWVAREGEPSVLVQDWTDAWDYANTDWRCGGGDPWKTDERSCRADDDPERPDASKCGEGQSCRQAARYGAVWLLPFHTGKDRSMEHPSAFTWYDELIISRERIPDPASANDPR